MDHRTKYFAVIERRKTMKKTNGALSPKMLRNVDAYWRAAKPVGWADLSAQ
jgi:hypothetical protein